MPEFRVTLHSVEMLNQAGRTIYAIAVVAFGVISLIWGEVLLGLEPIPASFPGREALAYLTGAVLVVAGVAMLTRRGAHIAAFALALLFTSWLLILHLPGLIAKPTSGGRWTTASELWAIGGVACVLAATYARGQSGFFGGSLLQTMGKIGRIAFALALPVFGILHFVYGDIVAGTIPAWFPARLFLAYAVGVAFCAAGASMLLKIKDQLAAVLLGLMFGIWVLVLHIPLVLTPGGQQQWTSLMVAVAMCGGAWVMADRTESSATS